MTPLKNGKSTSQLLQAYKQLMQEKVFDAIGMESTYITGILSSVSRDYAVSYGLEISDGKAKPFEKGSISINYIGGVGPAGQGVSNVEDMNRYLITLLNDGVNPDGQRVVKAETLQELWNVEGKETKTNLSSEGITGTTTYGMGLWIEEIKRKSNPDEKITVRHHGGFLPSWACMHMLVPDKKIGMVILTNGCFGRELTMEMNQELLNLLYDSDFDNFIPNEKHYNRFVEDLTKILPKRVSSDTIKSENLHIVETLLGNYEGGWTLALDQDQRLVLFKDGWVFHLYPSQEHPSHMYYIGASNNHRVMRVKQEKGRGEIDGGEIWFFEDENVIQMIGPQIGQIKKLSNLLESPEAQIAVLFTLSRNSLLPKFNASVNSLTQQFEALDKLREELKDTDKVKERIMKSDRVQELLKDENKVQELLKDENKLFELCYGRELFEDIKNSLKRIERMKQLIPAMISRYEKVPTSDHKETDDKNIRTLNEGLEYLEQLEQYYRNLISTSSN